ncbi:MAG TPA: Gldg family protein [Bacteroidota bacterium]|nr:Gldg family protein [Bacteroidota bacterium]
MKNTLHIFLKELRSFFDAPIAYIFIIIFLLLTGAYVASNLFIQNVASLRLLFEVVPVLFLFFAPAITMRLVSEERRSGTFEILVTKSIKTGEIVLGKFFAAWILASSALIPTMLYLISISLLGSIDIGPLLGGYLGLVLLVGVFIAIGIFGSTLSDNQIVAFIISIVVISILYLLDKILIYLPIQIVGIAEYIGALPHFSSLSRGVLDTRDIVYYLSVIILALLLATMFAGRESSRAIWKLRDFTWRQQILRVAITAGIIIFLNLISARMFTRIDLTTNKAYTLSDVTKELIESLEDDFVVKAYFSSELPPPYHNHRRVVHELLEEYRANSGGRVHYEFTNPLSDPEIERAAVREGVQPVQVKIIRNDQFQTEKAYVGLTFSYEDQHDKIPIVTTLDLLEYNITSCMKKVQTKQTRKIGILTGFSGPSLDKMKVLRSTLAKQYQISSVDITGGKAIPRDITSVLMIAPNRRFTDAEKFILDQFIMEGGRVGFFINMVAPDSQFIKGRYVDLNLDDMFDSYGWIINPDLVADARCERIQMKEDIEELTSGRESAYPLIPIAADFNQDHMIVRNLSQVMFYFVSSVDVRLASIRGVTGEELIRSSSKSKRYSDGQIVIDPRQNFAVETYTDRMIPLAATVEGSFRSMYARRSDAELQKIAGVRVDRSLIASKSPSTRVVVVGDGDFILDDYIRKHDNTSFTMNLVDWLVDDIVLTSIRARDVTPKPLNEVSENTRAMVKYMNFAGPPGIVVIVGIIRMGMKAARRRKHKSLFK